MVNFDPNHFLFKLHNLLSDSEDNETKHSLHQKDIVSWSPQGMDFLIHDPIKFIHVLSRETRCTTTFRSFQIEMKVWGFKRVSMKATQVDKQIDTTAIVHKKNTISTPNTATTTSQSTSYCYSHPMFQRERPELCKTLIRSKLKGICGQDKRGSLGLSRRCRQTPRFVSTARHSGRD